MVIDDTAVLIAIIGAVGTLIGGGFATWQQLKKDRRQTAVEITRLQDQIEAALWQRVKTELDTMQATIAEQGALIMQLRTRVQQLEAENGRLRIENEALKKGGKRI